MRYGCGECSAVHVGGTRGSGIVSSTAFCIASSCY